MNLYFFVQAMSLLQNNLENATGSLKATIEDMQFLRDQVTVTEVRISYLVECASVLWCGHVMLSSLIGCKFHRPLYLEKLGMCFACN